MRKPLLCFCLSALLLLTGLARQALVRAFTPPAPPAAPERIVSLAPSVTESLYALGLGPKVAGVTRFCRYPPEAAAKPHVGGFGDVNLEAVLRLRPDLAVLPVDKTTIKALLEQLGIPVLLLDTRSLPGLLGAIADLGAATGQEAKAEAILGRFDEALKTARAKAAGKRRPRVLFAVMHSYQDLGAIMEIHIIGRDGFYNELIEAAGGENVYKGKLAFPRLSREAIIFLDPDVIIDVMPKDVDIDMEGVLRAWHSLEHVQAIRQNRCFLLTDRGDTVPGPRSVLTLEKLSRILHPGPAERNMARIVP